MNNTTDSIGTAVLTLIRTQLYYILWFLPYTLIWSSIATLTAWFIPKKYRYAYIVKGWGWPLIWGARWIVGIQYEIRGREHIPASAVVICNHQSTWESIFFLVFFSPQIPVIKQSLVSIPLFGWALKLVEPIAIDRNNPRQAAKQVIDEGKKKLLAGVAYLLIYPEGTRNLPGNLGKFSRGGAVLAKQAGLPLLPVSQNSGIYWRYKKFGYLPGKVIIEIHPPINCTDITAPEAMNQARAVISKSLINS